MNQNYVFQGFLNINNGNAKTLSIESGDILQFSPKIENFENIDKDDIFQVTQLKHQGSSYVFQAKKSLVEKLINLSVAQTLVKSQDVFDVVNDPIKIMPPAHIESQLQENVIKHIDYLMGIISAGNTSANMDVINPYITDMMDKLEIIENHNFGTSHYEKALNFFSEMPRHIELANKNTPSKKSPYIYMKSIENAGLNEIKSALHWVENQDYSMVKTNLQDSLDIFRISQYIQEGNFAQAHRATHLDTYVREGLPSDFWEEWVCTNSPDNLQKQQDMKKTMKLVK